MSAASDAPVTSLYLHVPFCAHKCEYCAFYSEVTNGQLKQRYVAALIRELELVAHDLRPRTIFFGGGTPSLLSLKQWEQILSAIDQFKLSGAAEWTIECNPATVSLDKAQLWRRYGVNRVSMGVQSLDETLLARLGRIHSRAMVFKSFDILRQGGFENINLDLMFAIPGQTLDMWRATLKETIALGSEHLSCYEVIYEEDTPLFAQLQAGAFDVDEDLGCAMYDELIDRSQASGLRQYEVANFARDRSVHSSPDLTDQVISDGPPASPVPAYACRHNINYWRGGACYGLGPSAAGYVRGIRTKNWANTPIYCDQLEKGRRAIESSEELPPKQRAGEIAAFGLRMVAGWPFAEFTAATGYDLRGDWQMEMNSLVERKWGWLDRDHFALTKNGLRFADAAGAEFLRSSSRHFR